MKTSINQFRYKFHFLKVSKYNTQSLKVDDVFCKKKLNLTAKYCKLFEFFMFVENKLMKCH